MNRNEFDSLSCTVLCHHDIGVIPRNWLLRMFGLPGRMYYLPTGSMIKHRDECYSRDSLESIQKLVHPEEPDCSYNICPDMNGNVMVRMFYSTDRQFLALCICQYLDFEYRAVSPPYVFEGLQAEYILTMLGQ